MNYDPYVKRGLDLFVAIVAGIALSPLVAVIFILIKTFDPGPVIFRQKRVGKNLAEFCFYKFRSMPVDTADTPSADLGHVKLSWIGRVLRRTNLDELPQLVNVIKGEMSIVGPRPPIPSQDVLLGIRAQNDALKCVPGLTGLAQVSSFDGMSVSEKARLDGRYAANICFSSDMAIILRTFVYLFSKPPVY